DYLHANYSAEAFTPTYYVNGKYSAPMSEKFVRELNMLEPYGVGNRKPLFIMETKSCRARAIKEGSQHLSFKCGGLDLMYFSGAKFSKILKSAVPKEMVFEYAISYYRGKEQLQGYVRDVIYKPESCTAAEEDIALNGVLVASGEIIDCRASNISRSEAQEMLSGCGEYGTVFIVNSLSTLKKYDSCGLEVNIFTLSTGNLSNVILIAPIPECDLSGYENVVFLDSPAAITLPSLAGKRVLVCEEVDGTKGLTRLDTDRNALIEVFKRVSANAYNLTGDSLEDVARLNDLGATAEQALFALKVFEELGIITYKFGRLSVNRGVKSQLTNSRLYNYVSSVRD
ncbi:MAG: hypothetical protein K2N14_02350, partial [Clostridia bacterium]|nr:hypothetical protein [Clostridia bacterium]